MLFTLEFTTMKAIIKATSDVNMSQILGVDFLMGYITKAGENASSAPMDSMKSLEAYCLTRQKKQ